jgi:hypothetical protein
MTDRLRLGKDVDLSKADPNCACKGRGVKEWRPPTPEQVAAGQVEPIPVLCPCVVKRGGVRKDDLDDLFLQVSNRMKDGTFSKKMADQIRTMPEDQKSRAIRRLRKAVWPPKHNRAVTLALRAVLEDLESDGN